MENSGTPPTQPTRAEAGELLDEALARHLTALRRDEDVSDDEFARAVVLARYVRDTWQD